MKATKRYENEYILINDTIVNIIPYSMIITWGKIYFNDHLAVADCFDFDPSDPEIKPEIYNNLTFSLYQNDSKEKYLKELWKRSKHKNLNVSFYSNETDRKTGVLEKGYIAIPVQIMMGESIKITMTGISPT